MPGLVTMSSNTGANGSVNGTFHPERTMADTNSAGDRKPAVPDGVALGGPVNGIASLTNGQSQKPVVESPIAKHSSIQLASNTSSSLHDLPPELIHITEGYSSLGKLTYRVAQHCWLDLFELVEKLGAPSAHNDRPLMNGMSNGLASAAGDGNSVERKMRWLNWANATREKLIKLMVIADWSKKANEVMKMIDLMAWANTQDFAIEETENSLMQFKIDLYKFKLPNPDIKTALEILGTGKASWIPTADSRLLPLKKLTPQSMLDVLRDMDSMLSFRLTLHEDLPPHLRDWTIANGRATFTFPNEFEFDATLASDDPSKQLYFVDLRFLFSPAPRLGDGRTRNALSIKADELLKSSGLSGCAEFLRNFVLTQQIATLRSQAQQLRKAVWASSLRTDSMHRWLTVEYWANSSFPKSWIEVGIYSQANTQRLIPGHSSLPSLKAKWKQYGVEATPPKFDLLVPELSMERILKRFIAAHSISILREVKEKMQLAAGDTSSLLLDLSESDNEPADCLLKIRLGKFSQQVIFSIEEYSGKLTLSPVSDMSLRTERDLNSSKHPKADASAKLEAHICDEFLRSVEIQSLHSGWTMARKLRFSPDHIVEKFGSKGRALVFQPPGWKDSTWMIACTVNMQGEKWWAVEV
jgi:mediator of RNA polymerase II transcription subunit 14